MSIYFVFFNLEKRFSKEVQTKLYRIMSVKRKIRREQ